MKFEVLEKSYINNTIYEKGSVVDVDESLLAKNGGKIDMSKHSSLKPLEDIEVADVEETQDDDVDDSEETEGDEEPEVTEPTDAEKAQAISDALEVLDPADDEVWTQDGKPKVDTIIEVVGFDVTRKEIEAVAPEFTRSQSE